MFNILAVLGIAGVVGPGGFNVEVLTREFALMTGLAIALYLMARGDNSGTVTTTSPEPTDCARSAASRIKCAHALKTRRLRSVPEQIST